MAISNSSSSSINPQNGFCSQTLTFHSLRPPSLLPPPSSLSSVTDFIFSLLQSTTISTSSSFTDATTRCTIPFSDVPSIVRNLAVNLRLPPLSLSNGDSAFVISPNCSYVPILYLSMFSIGVVVSPVNPASSSLEISRLIRLCKPAVAFVTKDAVRKLLEAGFSNRIVVIESSEFESLITVESNEFESVIGAESNQFESNGDLTKVRVSQSDKIDSNEFESVNRVESDQSESSNRFESMIRVESNSNRDLTKPRVSQSDTAAILYSSGTTGRIKGVRLTHRNLISSIAGAIAGRQSRSSPAVYLCPVPYFHVYGFSLCVRALAFGDSLVSIGRFNLRLLLRSIEEFRVTHLPLVPPVVLALVDGRNEGLVNGTDWRSVEIVFSGAAPLTVAVIDKFKRRFPNVSLIQSYGLTETTGGISRIAGPYESTIVGTVGRLVANCEAKIVDPNTGAGLPPMKRGELWVRGPFVMGGKRLCFHCLSQTANFCSKVSDVVSGPKIAIKNMIIDPLKNGINFVQPCIDSPVLDRVWVTLSAATTGQVFGPCLSVKKNKLVDWTTCYSMTRHDPVAV